MMVLWIILMEKCLNEILESLKTEDEKMFFLKFEHLKKFNVAVIGAFTMIGFWTQNGT